MWSREGSEEPQFAGPVAERVTLYAFVEAMVKNSSRKTPAPRW